MFGNPETTTGGNALKFYASVRLDIRRAAQIKDAVKRLQKYFCRTQQEAGAEFAELQDLVRVLFDLTRHYIERLDQLKHKKNVLTFSDTELLTVRLLAHPDGKGGYEAVSWRQEKTWEMIRRRWQAYENLCHPG